MSDKKLKNLVQYIIEWGSVNGLVNFIVNFELCLSGTVCETTTVVQPTSTSPSTAGSTPCSTFTNGGTANGAMCVFPFTYQGQAYYECVLLNSQALWCATSANYDTDVLWGYCTGMFTIKCSV